MEARFIFAFFPVVCFGLVSLSVQAECGRQISLTPPSEFVTCCLSADQVLQYLTPAQILVCIQFPKLLPQPSKILILTDHKH